MASIGTTANLAIASVAGVINVLASTPLWVVYTRFASAQRRGGGGGGGLPPAPPPYDGVLHALHTIARDEGLGALWSGMVPSLMLVSNPTVQFAAYERLKVSHDTRLPRHDEVTDPRAPHAPQGES